MVPPTTTLPAVQVRDVEARRIAELLPQTDSLRAFVTTGAIHDVLLRAVEEAAQRLDLNPQQPPVSAAHALIQYVQQHGPRAAPARWSR